MIDTHLHILPGVDDGPETMQEVLALARALVQEGVHVAVATPHYNDLYLQRPAAEIRERVNEVQVALDHHEILLRLLPGHEALIKPGLVEDIRGGRLATLNGSRYLLLELWNSSWMPEIERVIFELKASGIVPIIAHPERCYAFRQDPERLARLIRQGALTQLTALSLTGKQGNTIRRTAQVFLKKGFIHCIASDAHDLKKRPPAILQALEYARELLGPERVYRMTEKLPAAIVSNEVYSL
jgi:protein-tyrosine phosphatase